MKCTAEIEAQLCATDDKPEPDGPHQGVNDERNDHQTASGIGDVNLLERWKYDEDMVQLHGY